ncbi:probable bifunctional methylthioribulose-1-phosphate dehydratase/enolase-phosphatase E1 [Selaginella moellendorffii]|uniref:probable bifunctional methylthioribulose-1-phosphate dehydratase/enolase-phosphatase E1 n=1 Tax=Selaginella moellendorffii TaxID=88036 RepID=UPI000D1CD4D9|nr:probable bifunctional methylthioribulose-1-phosphate dehydratase/enolase-phosphatase E1 [Selaginella moellendorffii]|eukprot:XP_024522590.1 probable bifunctional methylthioribulose-1-phosphate dehydratase/enolase-phosphatase E1 [Selaginella moellendorffii]
MGTVVESATEQAKTLVAALCRQFYGLGWVSGTGGGVTLKVEDPQLPMADRLIVMAPSGVQKEKMNAEDMYVLDKNGAVLSTPLPLPPPHKPPKCTDCAPLFMKAYTMRNAGAVIHSHGMESCLVTMIDPGAKEFRITHMEMIKGIKGHGYYDELVVPIIENSAYEYELTDSLAAAIAAYPRTTAVLVRNHGIYVWGDSWISAKTQAECYHYLFDAALKLRQFGLDHTDPLHGPVKKLSLAAPKKNYPRVILLDIEGTTTPISFVTDVLFPYARDNVGKHLSATYDSKETQDDLELLRQQASKDTKEGNVQAQLIPPSDAPKDEVIAAAERNVLAMIAADRKVTALKQLQGHIWRTGYKNGELKGQVFQDVPEALSLWHSAESKAYIYSSGSREAQRLIFGNTNFGDLRRYISGYFDTVTGNKREARSYTEIFLSVGADEPSQITFATDVLAEAVAAKEAGLDTVILERPGNAPLPSGHGFRTASTLLEI